MGGKNNCTIRFSSGQSFAACRCLGIFVVGISCGDQTCKTCKNVYMAAMHHFLSEVYVSIST